MALRALRPSKLSLTTTTTASSSNPSPHQRIVMAAKDLVEVRACHLIRKHLQC